MPVYFLASLALEGWPSWLPEPVRLLKYVSAAGVLALTKWYSSGASNAAERNLHGRVVMMTGGTSGIGAELALGLARRGAQIILLTQLRPGDPFLVDYVDDLRARAGHDMIYAEHVDLGDLHSVRTFATKWIDNAPPRRLDTIILCAATLTPPGSAPQETAEGVEMTWMVNFLANFHLLAILSPAIRAQPLDRDVRIIMTTCSSYIASPSLDEPVATDAWSPRKAYARSKLAMMVFGRAFQRHIDAYKRPDGLPTNARVILVDPGYTRTPGMRRWLTRGSLWGLVLYGLFYVFVWLFLKSPVMGAQSLLHAVMEASLGRGQGGRFIKECIQLDVARKEVSDDEVATRLWESSDKLIETLEKEMARKRLKAKKDKEARERDAKAAEQVEEIESLQNVIKKGKERRGTKGL